MSFNQNLIVEICGNETTGGNWFIDFWSVVASSSMDDRASETIIQICGNETGGGNWFIDFWRFVAGHHGEESV